MGELSRYNISQHDAGLENGKLKNKLGITDQKMLSDTETILLNDTYEYFLDLLHKEKLKRIDLKLLFNIHKYFLGSLYLQKKWQK